MNSFLQCAISDIIITPCNLYIWTKFLDKKLNFRSVRTYFVIISMYITTLLNYLYNNQFIRIVTITAFMSFFIKILFNERINKSIVAAILCQMLYMIAEMFFALILIYIFKVNPESFVTVHFGTVITNLVISLIVIILINLKFIKRFFIYLVKITNKIKSDYLIVLLLILMFAANIFAGITYYNFNFLYIMLFNILLTIICFIIVANSFYNKSQYIKVYDKYNTTLNSLKEYEDIMDRYRISNHENKNQLLTIRNMVPKTNKKIINYIDNVVENNLKDNDKVMLETAKIPAGGLRGLMYSKVLLMKNLNINYELIISNEVRTVDLINNIDDSTMLDICKVIGVYLDNSIQAVESIKDKYISIEMYVENKVLVISVSNTYESNIELDKIEIKGYTSKGKGHGYGLALAKEIIENNKELSNEKKISKELFTQILKIKM